MTDKKILEEVCRRLQDSSCGFRREGQLGVNRFDVRDFIEQEWQKQDGEQESLTMKMLSENPSKKWYTDVRDMERHRGLEIGTDGTVTEVK